MPPSPFPLPQRAYQFYFQQAHALAGFPTQLLAEVSYLKILGKQETHLFLGSQPKKKPHKGEEGQCGDPEQVLTFMEDGLAPHTDAALAFTGCWWAQERQWGFRQTVSVSPLLSCSFFFPQSFGHPDVQGVCGPRDAEVSMPRLLCYRETNNQPNL